MAPKRASVFQNESKLYSGFAHQIFQICSWKTFECTLGVGARMIRALMFLYHHGWSTWEGKFFGGCGYPNTRSRGHFCGGNAKIPGDQPKCYCYHWLREWSLPPWRRLGLLITGWNTARWSWKMIWKALFSYCFSGEWALGRESAGWKLEILVAYVGIYPLQYFKDQSGSVSLNDRRFRMRMQSRRRGTRNTRRSISSGMI